MKNKVFLSVLFAFFAVNAFSANLVFPLNNLVGVAQNPKITIYTQNGNAFQVGTNLVFGTLWAQPTNGVGWLANIQPLCYTAQIDGLEQVFNFCVPNDTNTYNVWNLVTNGITAPTNITALVATNEARALNFPNTNNVFYGDGSHLSGISGGGSTTNYTNIIHDAAGKKSIDPNTRQVFEASGILATLDYTHSSLNTAAGSVLDWDIQQMWGEEGQESVLWTLRQLWDVNGIGALDWNVRELLDTNAQPVAHWGTNGFALAQGVFAGSGASITALNASQITSGTVADARLTTNVDLLNANQTNNGTKTFLAAPALTLNDVTAGNFVIGYFGSDPLDNFNGTPFRTYYIAGSNIVQFDNGTQAAPVNIAAGIFYGSGAGLFSLPAGRMTGTLLAGQITNNSFAPTLAPAFSGVNLSGVQPTNSLLTSIPGNQTSNTFLAGPASGSAAAPAFRALNNNDFPPTLAPTFSAANLTSLPSGTNVGNMLTNDPRAYNFTGNGIVSNLTTGTVTNNGPVSGNIVFIGTNTNAVLDFSKGNIFVYQPASNAAIYPTNLPTDTNHAVPFELYVMGTNSTFSILTSNTIGQFITFGSIMPPQTTNNGRWDRYTGEYHGTTNITIDPPSQNLPSY